MGQYSITLTASQRETLDHLLKAGTTQARAITHAHILLKADQGSDGPKWSDRQIEQAFAVSYRTILRTRKRFVSQGLEAALYRQKQPERPQKRKVDGEQEAHILMVLCQEQPDGQEQWSLRLLRERVVELEIVPDISHETLRQVLKKTS